VLAALKALAKQVPPGAARDSLQEMVELAAKNADEAKRLGEVLVALTRNSDLAIALTKHPEALIAVMRHGPEAVELLGRFGRAGRGYERVVTEHIQKLNNPGDFIENWASLSPGRQQLLLRGWEDDLIRNRELGAIMRKLAAEVRP
jgi:hypothetical protein